MSTITGKVDFKKVMLAVNGIPENMPRFQQAVLNDLQKVLRDGIEANAPKSAKKAPAQHQSYSKSWKLGKITKDTAEVVTQQGKLYIILEFRGHKAFDIPKSKLIRFEDGSGNVIFSMGASIPRFDAIPHVRPFMRKFLQNVQPILYSHLDKASIIFANAAKQNQPKAKQYKISVKRVIQKKSGRKRLRSGRHNRSRTSFG